MARIRTAEIKAGIRPPMDLEKVRAMSKKPKVAPVRATMEKNTRKMQKMLDGMTIDQKTSKKGMADYSDSEDEEKNDMEIDQLAPVPIMKSTKSIFKKKPLNRQYYNSLKKTLRRKAKCGGMPAISDLDQQIQDAKMALG